MFGKLNASLGVMILCGAFAVHAATINFSTALAAEIWRSR